MPVRSDATTLVGTYDGHGPQAWTDLSPHSMFKDPNILIPAAEMTLHSEDQDRQDLYLRERKVIYTETVLNVTYKYILNLTFYQHPAGATALTVASEIGGLVGEDGAVAAAGDTHSTIAGVLLGKYFTVGVDSFGEAPIGPYGVTSLASDAFVATTISAGDGVWLVSSGTVVMLSAGAIAVDTEVIAANDGEIATGGGADGTLVLGTTRVLASGAGLALVDLRMPERLPPIS
tara:strand:- start:4540 stop:5235 length:696 start_codon:yes stop_codon:yes gene_type:complete